MVTRVFLLITIMLLTCLGCKKDLFPLRMTKTPYVGNELRTDGYYYSNLTSTNHIGIAVFYRDGFCIHEWGVPESRDTIGYIENDILLNNAYINKIKNAPSHIGVFQIGYPNITFEIWEYRTDTFTHFGNVVNDTTFIINKAINNRTNYTVSEVLTYRFKQFSPKPDSTNRFIK